MKTKSKVVYKEYTFKMGGVSLNFSLKQNSKKALSDFLLVLNVVRGVVERDLALLKK